MDGNCFNLFMLVLIYNKYSLVMIIYIVFSMNRIILCGKRTDKCVGTVFFHCGRVIQTLDTVVHPSVAWCMQILVRLLDSNVRWIVGDRWNSANKRFVNVYRNSLPHGRFEWLALHKEDKNRLSTLSAYNDNGKWTSRTFWRRHSVRILRDHRTR